MISQAVHVCHELNSDNLIRETTGLLEAMKTFGIKDGIIVTLSQTDELLINGMKIRVIPFHLLELGKT